MTSEEQTPVATDTLPTENDTERRRFIAGLREFADFMDAHPDLPAPFDPRFQWIASDRAELGQLARALGRVEKDAEGNYYSVKRRFGALPVEAWSHRDNVCERVVTGTRTVEQPVMEQVGTETVEEEVIEWHCPPSLLRGEQ